MKQACENLRFSQEQAAESLAGNCLDGEPSALLNTTTTPAACLWPDKMTDALNPSRYGTTCEPSTEGPGLALWMSSLAASPARTSAWPAKVQESAASAAGYGRKWPESFAKWDRDSCSWKTPQLSLLEGLDEFSGTWPRWGMMRGGAVFRLRKLEHPTKENVSGLWLPTPTCHNAKEGAYPAEFTRNTLTLAAHLGGRPHPRFNEWMMGWPEDWTALEKLAMDKFHQWLRLHGKL